jgi:hypothetical protein
VAPGRRCRSHHATFPIGCGQVRQRLVPLPTARIQAFAEDQAGKPPIGVPHRCPNSRSTRSPTRRQLASVPHASESRVGDHSVSLPCLPVGARTATPCGGGSSRLAGCRSSARLWPAPNVRGPHHHWHFALLAAPDAPLELDAFVHAPPPFIGRREAGTSIHAASWSQLRLDVNEPSAVNALAVRVTVGAPKLAHTVEAEVAAEPLPGRLRLRLAWRRCHQIGGISHSGLRLLPQWAQRYSTCPPLTLSVRTFTFAERAGSKSRRVVAHHLCMLSEQRMRPTRLTLHPRGRPSKASQPPPPYSLALPSSLARVCSRSRLPDRASVPQRVQRPNDPA